MIDTLELYRWAVQDPEGHAEVLRRVYAFVRPGAAARVLREDFAGTSAESVAWAGMDERHQAVAIDLDGAALAWAGRRAARLLGASAGRVRFVTGDVTTLRPPEVPAADVVSALNYSVLYLKDHAALAAYLRNAHASLAPRGVLMLNTFGGPEATKVGTTRHAVVPTPKTACEVPPAPFDYDWQVVWFDRAASLIECRIHFAVPSASDPAQSETVRDAFIYRWRLWSPRELLGACTHAGFRSVQVWRHTFDPARGAAGVYLGPVRPQALDGLATWNAYIVAGK